MEMKDLEQDIFDSALTDDAPEAVEPQIEAAPEPEVNEGPARDEMGRFAPKAAEPEPQAPAPQEQPEAREAAAIPSWRLKEEAEARRAAEERYQQTVRELAEIRAQFDQVRKQSEPPKAVPDIFEDANGFVQHNVSTAIDPIKQEIGQLREFYSQREATREFGAEKVKAAYDWIAQGMQSRDPERMAIYQRAMGSFDPYGEIVRSHQKQSLFEQIGSDPNAYVERQLEERMKDPAFQAKLLERIRGSAQARPGTTQLPPSLNRVSGAAPAVVEDGDDNSDEGIFKYATR
jgi:hypothetical protein